MKPKRIVKYWNKKDPQRSVFERNIFSEGYTLVEEEAVNKFNPTKAAGLGLLFLPLALLGSDTQMRCTYELQ